METKALIEKHQTAIEIIEAIQHFETKIRIRTESLNGLGGTFPGFKKKCLNDIDIYQRCIIRMKQRYGNCISQINSL